ncbi:MULTISPECIES: polyphosphate polymerase domain-containing protein [Prochlorococcus]|uniref:Uncharacterized conserved protein n=1 Tax=Prochlorococcus marinus (strain SARG / CCMP1375 / SS120) TaxID=167539 RepID=Q7VB34_PROMA|nr:MULTISPECIES: polyphosphate polymerase domain-containing protein [Prochlorococcus]AAQ00310.1 Uncharacterized conserved protein [Prochlorococcus marinus subsp. marinus str. CCMP1375]KGG14122.1 hypothetical protein EV04_0607 [Prochlorococcus marinus str. LG]KGG20709.1 hypothetical protein EV08_0913 [Prochlorococcus marinus str. SS2]KGG25110.1 hypothetical protein EV09_0004 [Prochlorococcus marinus str. SS35]KGG33337.1 hypothetical protein EV10_0544 [Prochlorococcus marinus str. SS51]
MANSYTKKFRYERKLIVPSSLDYYLDFLIKSHPARFKQSYKDRSINNVYFDTLNYEYYNQNISGLPKRDKFRVRWYGELYGLISPIVEIKSKRGSVGTKSLYKVDKFSFIKSTSAYSFRNQLLNAVSLNEIKLEIMNCYPTLLNTYKRKYFESYDGKFRITIDTDIKSHNIRLNTPFHSFFNVVNSYNILELKYDKEDESMANLISSNLPFRLTKYSKYVNGMQSVVL